MNYRFASVPGYCCWLAAASFAAIPAAAQSARMAPAKGSGAANEAALRSLDGLSIVPTWSASGKQAIGSRVRVRVNRMRGSAADFIEFDINLRSLPTRAEGPDNDRAGADPNAVQLRSAQLTYAGVPAADFPRFRHWYDNTNAPPQDVIVDGSSSLALYTEALREYTEGRPSPAYFWSRCLIRVPLASVAAAAQAARIRGVAPNSWRLHLTTAAGELFVPLAGGLETQAAPQDIPIAVMTEETGRDADALKTWN